MAPEVKWMFPTFIRFVKRTFARFRMDYLNTLARDHLFVPAN